MRLVKLAVTKSLFKIKIESEKIIQKENEENFKFLDYQHYMEEVLLKEMIF